MDFLDFEVSLTTVDVMAFDGVAQAGEFFGFLDGGGGDG